MTTQSQLLAAGSTVGIRNASGKRSELDDRYSALLRHVLSHHTGPASRGFAVGFTSCGQGAGVTTVAVNLAITASRGGQRRVLIIDANKNHTTPASLLSLKSGDGLSELLVGQANLGDCVAATGFEGMSYLPRGSERPQMGTDFTPADLANLLEEIRSEFDLVVVDLPEADALSECVSLAAALDGVMLVLEAGRIDREVAKRAQQRLANGGAPLLGAVYNKQR